MRDCWLTPNGEIIEVGTCQHNEYASNLLEEEMGLEELYDYMDKNNMYYPYEVLHHRGWVRIKFNTAYLPRVHVEGYFGCIMYKFDLLEFLSSEWFKEIHNLYMIALSEKKRNIDLEYDELLNLKSTPNKI